MNRRFIKGLALAVERGLHRCMPIRGGVEEVRFFLLGVAGRGLLCVWLATSIAIGGCGGGHQPTDAEVLFVAGANAQAPRSDLLRTRLQARVQAEQKVITTDQLFRWAQLTYPEYFPDSPPIGTIEYAGTTYEVRAYFNGNFLGVTHGRVYGLGSFTGNVVQDFGSVADYASQVCATLNCDKFASGDISNTITVKPRPSTIRGTKLLGTPLWSDSVQIKGTLEGDVAALQNQSIYTVVEDPDRLFESPGRLDIFKNDAGWEYNVELTGRLLDRPGRFSGELKVYACLDSLCQTRIAGTPVTIPYDVAVVPRLAFSPSKIEVTVPFGTKPADILVDTNLDAIVQNAGGWRATLEDYSGIRLSNGVRAEIVPSSTSTGKGARVRLEFLPLNVGTYEGRVAIDVGISAGEQYGYIRETQYIDVVYKVTPEGLPAIQFSRDALVIPLGFGFDWYPYATMYVSLTRNRDKMSVEFLGFEYLKYPVGETSPQRTQWLTTLPNALTEGQFDFSLRPCTPQAENGTKQCLGKGDYLAQARFRVRYPHPTSGAEVVEEFVIAIGAKVI